MSSAIAESPPPVASSRPAALRVGLLLAALALLWFLLCRQLSYEWTANEQYSYGWFVPFFAAFLFWLRVEDSGGPVTQPRNRGARPGSQRTEDPTRRVNCDQKSAVSGQKANRAGDTPAPTLISDIRPLFTRRGGSSAFFLLLSSFFLLLLFPVRLFEVANPDWRPLSWIHALAVVGLTLLVIYYGRGKAALRHFAFPVCFILVAVPWVTPIEAPLVQWLMRLVAAVATEALTLLGIPAQLEGSLIRVNNGVVGVSEACSGVRSLQTSLMIGLLFGELKRLTIARRLALVATALAIALLANFGRAFFLVWVAATQNLAAVERWHDIAGYAIVGAVFIGTITIASALGQKGESKKAKVENEDRQATASTPQSAIRNPHFRFPTFYFLLSTLAFLILIEASVSAWYRWHERNFVPTTAWSVRWPENAPGFRELPIDENIRSTLRYDEGREASWRVALAPSPGATGFPANCTMFFFRWEPGSASILRARAHRPDICLPNTGWRMTSDDGVRTYAASPGLALPFRHFRFTRDGGNGRQLFAQAFFCQREDRVPASGPGNFDTTSGQTGNWMRDDRVRVVREGLRNQGQQVLELVLITPNEMTSAAAEAEFATLVPRLVKQVSE